MKTLYLLRHAQAMPSDGKADRERKLSPQGLADARALGIAMKQKDYVPDFIFCSPATRTKETLAEITKSLNNKPVEFPDRLYDGSRGDLLAFIQNTDDAHDSMLMVAHNPGIHELAAMLAQDDGSAHTNRLAGGYSPGALSVLECPTESWADIQPGQNTLTNFLDPLDYNAPSTPARWT